MREKKCCLGVRKNSQGKANISGHENGKLKNASRGKKSIVDGGFSVKKRGLRNAGTRRSPPIGEETHSMFVLKGGFGDGPPHKKKAERETPWFVQTNEEGIHCQELEGAISKLAAD